LVSGHRDICYLEHGPQKIIHAIFLVSSLFDEMPFVFIFCAQDASGFNYDGIGACLRADADDYMIIKPIRVTELIGRLQVLPWHTWAQQSAHTNKGIGDAFDYPCAIRSVPTFFIGE